MLKANNRVPGQVERSARICSGGDMGGRRRILSLAELKFIAPGEFAGTALPSGKKLLVYVLFSLHLTDR